MVSQPCVLVMHSHLPIYLSPMYNVILFHRFTTHTHTHTQALLCQRQLENSARSTDFSPDGQQVVVGLTSGEFLLLSSSDLSTVASRRDRSKTIQAVR